MTSMSVFSFDNSVVRTNTDASGVVWFCARDVAAAIEHSKSTVMLELVEEDEVRSSYSISDTLGRQQQVPFVSEPGLYRILFRSSLPKCKPFQNWLATEVQAYILD